MVRFRKSKSFGGLRLTANKSSLSISGGIPGLRVGVNTRGQVRRTVRVPGTGLYDTKVVGGAAAPRRGRGKSTAKLARMSGPSAESQEVRLTAVDATGGSRNLQNGDAGVASAQVAGVRNHAEIARLAGLLARSDGWIGGLRQGVLVEQGSEYRVILIVSHEDNPSLFHLQGAEADLTPCAMDIGRLAKRDHDKWAPAFKGRSIAVVVFVAGTPGMSGTAEVRFLPDQLDAENENTLAAPTAPAGW